MQMSDAISEILKRTFFLRIELQIATKFFAILHLNSGTFKLFGCRVFFNPGSKFVRSLTKIAVSVIRCSKNLHFIME